MFDDLFAVETWVPKTTPVTILSLKVPLWVGATQVPAGDKVALVNGEYVVVEAAVWAEGYDPQP